MGNAISLIKSKVMSISPPIIVILGSTGTGKSKLGIQLAKTFNGEIISADSMQVYKGLDIITNKVSFHEQAEAVHHLINVIEPLHRYTVVDFRNQALGIIEELLRENKLPIIVGGTNYYIESLLWDVLIKPRDTKNKLLDESESQGSKRKHVLSTAGDIFQHEFTWESLDGLSNETLHEILQQVDPSMANSLHPQDRRKVIRSLQVYQQHGCPHSKLISEQRSQDGGSSLGGPLRYPNAAMLWVQCENEVLEQRLEERVEEMLSKGLIEEMLKFHKDYNERRLNERGPSYTEGIFQSIGFKEFHQYLILSEEERKSEYGQKILARAIEDMNCVTKKYAKKQIKWIRNRFLRKPDRQVPPVYALNATDLSLWDENVLKPAIKIVHSVIQGEVIEQSPLPMEEALHDVPESHFCDVCQRIFVGQRVWEIHLKSKRHSKMKASLKKREITNKAEKEKESVSS